MSNAVQIKIIGNVTIPASISRTDAKNLIAGLFGANANAFATVSGTAAREAFIGRCLALAMAQGIYRDSSRLQRYESFAASLPEYKKDRNGNVSGRIGKLLASYSSAVEAGKVFGDTINAAEAMVDLTWFANSASFAALFSEEKKVKAITTAPATETATATATETATATDTAPTTGGYVSDYEKWHDWHNPETDSAVAFNFAKAQRDREAAEALPAPSATSIAQWRGIRSVDLFRQLADELHIKLTIAQLRQLEKLAA